MFDRFTDRARLAIAYARQEAVKFNHDFIGTEHVLLGLLREEDGAAYEILKESGATYEKAEGIISKFVARGPSLTDRINPMPFTPITKKLFEISLETANNQGSKLIGTEHLLYALTHSYFKDSVGCRAFLEMDINPEEIREKIQEYEKERGLESKVPETNKEIPQTKKEGYWEISKTKMTLEEALEKAGFSVKKETDNYMIIYAEDKTEQIGEVRRIQEGKNDITIEYDINNYKTTHDALNLRDFLERAGESYGESPTSEEIAKKLELSIQDTTKLIRRLKRKQAESDEPYNFLFKELKLEDFKGKGF